MATLQDFIDSAQGGFEAVAEQRNTDREEWLGIGDNKAGVQGQGVAAVEFRAALNLGDAATKAVGTEPGKVVLFETVASRGPVNIRDLGVVSHASLNQTALIQAADTYAASQGRALYFPAGTYVATVLEQTTSWVGDGPSKTILKAGSRTYGNGDWFIRNYGKNALTLSGINVDFSGTTLPSGELGTTIASASGNGSTCTLTLSDPTIVYPTGQYITVWKTSNPGVTDIGPSSYFGLFTVTGSSPGTVSYAHTATGALPVAGKIQANPGNIFCIYASFLSTNLTVTDCLFTGIRDHVLAIALSGCNDATIHNNKFFNYVPSAQQSQCLNVSTAHGPSERVKFFNNYSYGCGVFSDGAHGEYHDNIIEVVGFGANICSGPKLSGLANRIYNNVFNNGFGMDVNYTYVSGVESWNAFTTITGNTIIGNSGHGISFASNATVISNNLIVNNGNLNGSGICAYGGPGGFGVDNASIVNNIVQDNRGGGMKQLYGYAEYDLGGGILGVSLKDNILTPNLNGSMLQSSALFDFSGPKLRAKFTGFAVGTLAPGTSAFIDVTIAGARFGDLVTVSLDVDPLACIVYGEVNDINSVRVYVQNSTATSRAVGTTSGNVMIEKPAGYNY